MTINKTQILSPLTIPHLSLSKNVTESVLLIQSQLPKMQPASITLNPQKLSLFVNPCIPASKECEKIFASLFSFLPKPTTQHYTPSKFVFLEEEIVVSLSDVKLDSKTAQLIKTPSQTFSTVMMTPFKRLIDKKSVGEEISKDSFMKVVQNPFLGAGLRGINSLVWAGATFGTSAIVHHQFENQNINPTLLEATSTAVGVIAGTILTAPFSTISFKMGVQDKSFATVCAEIFSTDSKKVLFQRLYPDLSTSLARDMIYLPIFFSVAKHFKNRIEEGRSLPPLQQMVNTSFSFITAGAIASLLSYPLQFACNQQKNSAKPISPVKIFRETVKAHGPFGLYRGYGASLGGLVISNLFFGFAMGGMEIGLKGYKFTQLSKAEDIETPAESDQIAQKILAIVEPY